MNEERILSLDVSSKTGWALLVSSKDGCDLEAYGQIPAIHEPDGGFPKSYIDWAYIVVEKIVELVERHHPDVLVIEQTSAGSKAIFTQKFLEWVHFVLAKFIVDNRIKVIYYLTEQWRRETGCLMSKEEKKRNKEVKQFKTKNKTSVAYDIKGKRIGKITRKHVNIRRANEVFESFLNEPLRKKDEDTADSLLLGYAYHQRRVVENERI
jgi:hypothetical protein